MRWMFAVVVTAMVAMLTAAMPAYAHLTPNSEVRMTFGDSLVELDVVIPQGDYAAATGNPVTNDPRSLASARRYLLQSVNAAGPDGGPWRVTVQSVAFEQIAGPPDLHAVLRLEPPEATSPRGFDIAWRAIIREIPGHFVLFVVDTDFAGGKLDDRIELVGSLQGDRTVLRVDRGKPSRWSGFMAAFRSGMHHIAIGYDHMLFLLVSLLPLPLLAQGRRWAAHRPARPTLWAVLAVVTAFTIGHSATLVLAAAMDLKLPAQPVEIVIALSILVSAIHALRPLFPGREAVVAGLFGLIHGLAFATLITRIGIGATERTLAILGFNLGIEAAQLVIVAIATPLLLILTRSRAGTVSRLVLATLAAGLAVIWLAERTTGVDVLGHLAR
jgi:hypothetical protein